MQHAADPRVLDAWKASGARGVCALMKRSRRDAAVQQTACLALANAAALRGRSAGTFENAQFPARDCVAQVVRSMQAHRNVAVVQEV